MDLASIIGGSAGLPLGGGVAGVEVGVGVKVGVEVGFTVSRIYEKPATKTTTNRMTAASFLLLI